MVDRTSGVGQGFLLNSRTYKIIPDGFNLDTLVNIESEPAEELQKIGQVMDAASHKFKKYFSNPLIKFLSKKREGNSEKFFFMVKTLHSYAKFSGRWTNEPEHPEIQVSNLILTKDKDEDYSNCSQWDQKGKCLSCREGEVEYQGSCFDRLEGCLIQPGDICVRCSSNYVQSGYKCYRGCSSFFD